jgi:hypothetical protein
MALPMHLRASETDAFEAALASAEDRGTEADRAEATLIRQQLALHASYVHVCQTIERFSDGMRESSAHLVPLRFPIRLTPKTRECVEDGMFRSFLRFLEDLHAAVLAQHKHGVDDLVTDTATFLTKIANALTLESCRVLDGEASPCEARNVCTSYIDKCRRAVVRQESAELLELDSACGVIIDCLRRFDVHASKIRKRVKERLRDFLRAAERRGLSEAAGRLQRARQTRALLERHSWMLGGEFDDARIKRIYELLLVTHTELAQGLMWQQRRIAWLASANAANRCWSGLALATGIADGRVVQAPAHMRSLSGEQRVRIVVETEETPFACLLSTVAVADLTVELLHERHLPLNRISAAYADRVLTFDFCKYESAARNILEETVRPWHERQLACELS